MAFRVLQERYDVYLEYAELERVTISVWIREALEEKRERTERLLEKKRVTK